MFVGDNTKRLLAVSSPSTTTSTTTTITTTTTVATTGTAEAFKIATTAAKAAEAPAELRVDCGDATYEGEEPGVGAKRGAAEWAGPAARGPEVVWTWERLRDVPQLGAAFMDFARKALCEESVLFLQEVTRYHLDVSTCICGRWAILG